MQSSKRYCKTSCKKIHDSTLEMISRIGKHQLEQIEEENKIKITSENIFETFSIDFILHKLCPVLKNLNDRNLIKSIIDKTQSQILQCTNQNDITNYNKIIEYLS